MAPGNLALKSTVIRYILQYILRLNRRAVVSVRVIGRRIGVLCASDMFEPHNILMIEIGLLEIKLFWFQINIQEIRMNQTFWFRTGNFSRKNNKR